MMKSWVIWLRSLIRHWRQQNGAYHRYLAERDRLIRVILERTLNGYTLVSEYYAKQARKIARNETESHQALQRLIARFDTPEKLRAAQFEGLTSLERTLLLSLKYGLGPSKYSDFLGINFIEAEPAVQNEIKTRMDAYLRNRPNP